MLGGAFRLRRIGADRFLSTSAKLKNNSNTNSKSGGGSGLGGYLVSGKKTSSGPAIKRFWRDVEIDGQSSVKSASSNSINSNLNLSPGDGKGYVIKLDGRPLKTPDGRLLTCQSKMVSVLIASEWQNYPFPSQPKSNVSNNSETSSPKDSVKVPKRNGTGGFPVTAMVARSIDAFHIDTTTDQEQDPAAPQRTPREIMISGLMKYLDTDTITQFQNHPETLHQLQQEKWTPLLQWTSERFNVELKPSYAHEPDSLFNTQQPDETRQTLEKHVTTSYDNLTLVGFEKAVMYSKSFLIALALFERRLDVKGAVEAARVEYLAQSAAWGRVEDVHDVDEADLERHLGCAASVLLAASK